MAKNKQKEIIIRPWQIVSGFIAIVLVIIGCLYLNAFTEYQDYDYVFVKSYGVDELIIEMKSGNDISLEDLDVKVDGLSVPFSIHRKKGNCEDCFSSGDKLKISDKRYADLSTVALLKNNRLILKVIV